MGDFIQKWGLIGKALVITAVLVIVRLLIDIANYDIIALTTLVTAFIGAAIFTVAIIFAGTLTDYKESEKIPSEIGVLLLSLYQDTRLFGPSDVTAALHLKEHVRSLTTTIIGNFRANIHTNNDVRAAIRHLNEDIYTLVDKGAPPQYVVKFRTDLVNLDRVISRVRTITETSFIPAAYAIAEISVAGVVLILFFVKIDPYYEGMVIFSIIILLMVSILLLIKDMDNPFEHGKKTFADVDMTPIFDIEKFMK